MKHLIVLVVTFAFVLPANSQTPQFVFDQSECEVVVFTPIQTDTKEAVVSSFKSWARDFFWETGKSVQINHDPLSNQYSRERSDKLFRKEVHLEELWIKTVNDTVVRLFKNSKLPNDVEYSLGIRFTDTKIKWHFYSFLDVDSKADLCDYVYKRNGELKKSTEAERLKSELETYVNRVVNDFLHFQKAN